MSAGISAGTAAAVGAGLSAASAATSIATGIAGAVGGGGSSGGGTVSSGGKQFQVDNSYVPRPSTNPLSNNQSDTRVDNGQMQLDNKVATAKVTTANEVPAARDRDNTVTDEYGQVWANRLNRYLDYNTRTLG